MWNILSELFHVIFQICLGMIFPPFIVFGLEILNLGETQMSAFQKLGVFYSSPLSKFAHGMVCYSFYHSCTPDENFCMTDWWENIRVFNGYEMWIVNSVTRVTVWYHKACRVMPNSDPDGGIFLSAWVKWVVEKDKMQGFDEHLIGFTQQF